MDHEFFVHFTGRAGQAGFAAVGVDEEGGELFVRGGLVVHGQQGAVAAVGRLAVGRQAKVLDAVVVVTCAVAPFVVGAIVFECRGRGGQWVAQRVQHAGCVAFGNDHAVGQALANGFEAQGAE